jgi:ActR/RegA family two-component response regulator
LGLVTAFADIRSAVSAMRDGALNYLAKPIDLDELMATVRLALAPGSEPETAREPETPMPQGVVTQSPLMQAVFRDAAVIAPSETRVSNIRRPTRNPCARRDNRLVRGRSPTAESYPHHSQRMAG